MSNNAAELPLQLWTNEVDTVIAHSEDDACLVMSEHIGCTLEEYRSDYEQECWTAVSPDSDLKIYEECYTGEPVTKPAREWLGSGRDFLASTEC